VRNTHLYLLQFDMGRFGASWWGEMVLLFKVWCGGREASYGLGVQNVAGFVSD
jgi:hypothetical protein